MCWSAQALISGCAAMARGVATRAASVARLLVVGTPRLFSDIRVPPLSLYSHEATVAVGHDRPQLEAGTQAWPNVQGTVGVGDVAADCPCCDCRRQPERRRTPGQMDAERALAAGRRRTPAGASHSGTASRIAQSLNVGSRRAGASAAGARRGGGGAERRLLHLNKQRNSVVGCPSEGCSSLAGAGSLLAYM
jgi:hypothetical protein